MKRGEIYIVPLDPILGREQQGTRPVIVISSDDFNRLTRLPVILPITNGGAFAQAVGFAVPLSGTGLRTVPVITSPCAAVSSFALSHSADFASH